MRLAVALGLFFGVSASAETLRLGLELTVTGPGMSSRPEGIVAVLDGLEKLRLELIRNCPAWNCKVETIKDKEKILRHRVTYKDGFYFDVSVDAGVLEVTAAPLVLGDWKKQRDRIQNHFFDPAAALGMTPAPDRGGGHIHMDGKAFEADSRLLRNWIVDFHNHPEVAFGVLRHVKNKNGALWAHLSEQTQAALRGVIKRFDFDLKAGNQWSSTRLAQAIYDEVQAPAHQRGEVEQARYFALNFERYITEEGESRTVEIRSVKPPSSMDEFLLQAGLVDRRIEYLKGKTELIAFKPGVRNWDGNHPEEAVAQFDQYLTEMGAKLSDGFVKLLSPALTPFACKLAFRTVK